MSMFDELPEPPGAWNPDLMYGNTPTDEGDDDMADLTELPEGFADWEPPQEGSGSNALVDGETDQNEGEKEDAGMNPEYLRQLQVEAKVQAINSVPRRDGMTVDDLIADAKKLQEYLLADD